MSELLVTVGAYVSLGILLVSGAGHLRNPIRFKWILREHHVWPRILEWPLVLGLGVTEIAIGGAGVLGTLRLTGSSDSSDVLVAACLSAVVLYFLFAIYATYLPRRHRAVSCGCGSGGEQVNTWTIVRAVVLAAFGMLGAYGADTMITSLMWDVRAFLGIVAGMTFAVVIWNLPAALHLPTAIDIPTTTDTLPASELEAG